MTYTELARIYNISRSSLYNYIRSYKSEIDAAGDFYIINDKKVKRPRLNKRQINLIVKAVGDLPENYKLVRGALVKLIDGK